MSDTRLRRLEQAYRASGDGGDALAYLQARLRSGRLDRRALQAAAYLGDAVAASFLEAEGLLIRKAPRTGVSRFLSELPGDAQTRVRAALAALEWLRTHHEPSLRPSTLAVRDALWAWHETPPPAAAVLERLQATLTAQEADFAASRPFGFNPTFPVVSYTYEVEADDAADLLCWALAREVCQGDPHAWAETGRCLHELRPRRAAEGLRAAVREALLPWVLLRDPAGDVQPPTAQVDSILGAASVTPDVAAAVLAAAPAGSGRPSVSEARSVIEAYFLALGYRPSRGALVNPQQTRRVKLMKRGLQLLEGKPGDWTKIAANRGRELRLTDTAVQLIQLAQRQARD